jgi:hypothetical protein
VQERHVCGGGVGVKMAEVVCVKFEYLGYRNSQDLCGGGDGGGDHGQRE